MKDKTFHDNVDQFIKAYCSVEKPTEDFIRGCMSSHVWPAMNRFCRFSEAKKHFNFEDFTRLCSAVALMMAKYQATQPPEPKMKKIGAYKER